MWVRIPGSVRSLENLVTEPGRGARSARQTVRIVVFWCRVRDKATVPGRARGASGDDAKDCSAATAAVAEQCVDGGIVNYDRAARALERVAETLELQVRGSSLPAATRRAVWSGSYSRSRASAGTVAQEISVWGKKHGRIGVRRQEEHGCLNEGEAWF